MKKKSLIISQSTVKKFVAILILTQMSIWYAGIADFIPAILLTNWNKIQLGLTVAILIVYFSTKRYINSASVCFFLWKCVLVFSTFKNGYEISIFGMSKLLCLLLVLEFFENDMETFIKVMMIIFEVMIYYNLYVCISTGPDLYGAYYGALGYDNGFPPYLIVAYIVAYYYWKIEKKTIRPIGLVIGIHITLLVTMVGTGLAAIFLVDILLVLNILGKIRFSLWKSYICFMTAEIAIIFFRIQNLFSYIIVDILGKDLTFTGRIRDWDNVMTLIPDKFFLGYGGMSQLEEKNVLGDVYSHNAVLEQFFRGGLLYFLMFAIAIYVISKQLKNMNRPVGQGGICILCGYWILAMTEIVLEDTICCFAFMIVLFSEKFLIAENERKEKQNEKSFNNNSCI